MGSEGGGGECEVAKWRYTWEAQSHISTLRLLLIPISQNSSSLQSYHHLTALLHSPPTFLTLTSSTPTPLFLRVPIPTLLLNTDSPPTVRALSDHIEVKLVLLLPVDHPALSAIQTSPPLQPLVMDYDVDKLSAVGEVDFYCRSCSFALTKKPIRNFVEMPSANWREVADNWFGACCCSFGGISEKLVTRYVNSHTCAPGICLLSSTSATLCKDDLVECNYPCPELLEPREFRYAADDSRGDGVSEGTGNFGLNGEINTTCSNAGEVSCASDNDSRVASPENGKLTGNFGLNREINTTCSDAGEVCCASDEDSRIASPENGKLTLDFRHEVGKNEPDCGGFAGIHLDSNDAKDVTNIPSCCAHMTSTLGDEDGENHLSGTAEILGNQKSFLNGFLEDVFMARLSNLSKDIEWLEFECPQCHTLLGAYPCCEASEPVDGGVRLFKCYVSTCLPVEGSGDVFSNYKLDKMFASQLMECANDESSFRFIIRDLTTKSPVLQVILLNPDTWSCSGICSSSEDKNTVPELQLQPVIKVLFSDCRDATTESQLRVIEEWATKSSAENIFMVASQIEYFVDSLMSAKDIYPPSCASLQGLILASVRR